MPSLRRSFRWLLPLATALFLLSACGGGGGGGGDPTPDTDTDANGPDAPGTTVSDCVLGKGAIGKCTLG